MARASDEDEIGEKLWQLEHEYWQAMKDRDVATAVRLSDEPCLVAGASGVSALDRATLESMMASASYELESFELKEKPIVRVLGDDVAVLAYKVHEELIVDGKPVKLDASESSTWVRRDGQWLCALHTEALSGDPFGRDRKAKSAKRTPS